MSARLAERLGYAATLLRAEAAAILVLEGHEVRASCAVGIDPSTGHRAATRIARAGGFVREYGVCSECGESRLVTRSQC